MHYVCSTKVASGKHINTSSHIHHGNTEIWLGYKLAMLTICSIRLILITEILVHILCMYNCNKPWAETGTESLVHTCTVNGLSDSTSDMTVNNIEPSDSSALLVLSRKLTTKIIK